MFYSKNFKPMRCMVEENQLKCCPRCNRLKFGDGEWVQVDPGTINIIAEALVNGCCDICADSVYDEMVNAKKDNFSEC